MVDVELLLSDNGGVRIYPTEWQNLTVRAFFHTADIPYVVSENSGVEDGTSIPALNR